MVRQKGQRTMHGFARLKLVGTPALDGLSESFVDDAPKSLPFPSCMRDLNRGSRDHGALDALERVTFNFEQLRNELATTHGSHEGPRAA